MYVSGLDFAKATIELERAAWLETPSTGWSRIRFLLNGIRFDRYMF